MGEKGHRVTAPRANVDIDFTRRAFRMEVYHRLNEKIGFGAFLPYLSMYTKSHRTHAETHTSGLMDLGGFVTYSPWESKEAHEGRKVFAPKNLTFIAGFTAPTASDKIAPRPGLVFGQRGRGTTGVRLGTAYNATVADKWGWYSSFFYQTESGSDRRALRFGNIYDWRTGTTYNVWNRLQLRLAFDGIHRRKHSIRGRLLQDSGGTWLFIGPGLALNLTKHINLDAELSLPTYFHVDQAQNLSGPVFKVGASFSW